MDELIPSGSGRPLSQEQYWKTCVTPFQRLCVLGGGIVCFIMGISTLISLGVLGLLDGLLIAGLGYGICFRRSRACAVAAGVYYALNYLMLRLLPLGNLLNSASAMMIVFIALLIFSIYGTFAFQSSYAQYLSGFASANAAPGPMDDTKKS